MSLKSETLYRKEENLWGLDALAQEHSGGTRAADTPPPGRGCSAALRGGGRRTGLAGSGQGASRSRDTRAGRALRLLSAAGPPPGTRPFFAGKWYNFMCGLQF